ncbi:hypothetical protein [Aliiroseovarius sp.]
MDFPARARRERVESGWNVTDNGLRKLAYAALLALVLYASITGGA